MKQVANTPLNRLFLAINHYISTGDYLGEGVANDRDTHIEIVLLVNETDPVDVTDFQAFTSRFYEIALSFSISLADHGILDDKGPVGQVFHLYTFLVDIIDMDELARRLTERPGKRGWGSTYNLIPKK